MKKYHQKGFTAIELLTVIGIISVLVAIAAPSYALMKKNVTFTNTVQEIVNTLRVAQNNSTSSQDGKMWGVKFEQITDGFQYILFVCNDVDNTTCTTFINKTIYQIKGLTIVLPASNPIIFNRLFGTLYNASGPQTIGVEKGGGSIKNIIVELDGKISL